MSRSQDLPPYTVRISKRATRVILKIAPHLGLEVVIPDGFDHRRIPTILDKKRQWIRATYQRLCVGNPRECMLPDRISLKAIGRTFLVRCICGEGPGLRLDERHGDLLILKGEIGNTKGCTELLKSWLREIGRNYLIACVEKCATRTGLEFKRLQVRNQRSRWGSYSSNGTLSLNCKLLFLPQELVHYTIIHELCHAVHLNHSGQFWHLVSTHCPAYELLETRLIDAQKDVPGWAE